MLWAWLDRARIWLAVIETEMQLQADLSATVLMAATFSSLPYQNDAPVMWRTTQIGCDAISTIFETHLPSRCETAHVIDTFGFLEVSSCIRHPQ